MSESQLGATSRKRDGEMDIETTVKGALGRGRRLLGAMVYWTGLTDVRIARPLWRQGLDIAGVADAVSGDPGSDALLNTACQFATRRQPRGGDRVRIELKAKGQDAIYRVMVPRPQVDGRARTLEEATISVDCYAEGAEPVVDLVAGVAPHADRDRVVADVVEWFGELRNYIFTDEVSSALVDIVKHLHGAPLRTGVYFVPASQVDRLHAVKRFIESSTTAHVTAWNINADDQNTVEARHTTREVFTARLDDVIAKVQKFTATVTPDDALARSVNAKVKLFKELEAEVELWSDVLGDYVAQLNTTIATAKQTLLGKYLGLVDDDASTEAA
jgi:hypothetical protein